MSNNKTFFWVNGITTLFCVLIGPSLRCQKSEERKLKHSVEIRFVSFSFFAPVHWIKETFETDSGEKSNKSNRFDWAIFKMSEKWGQEIETFSWDFFLLLFIPLSFLLSFCLLLSIFFIWTTETLIEICLSFLSPFYFVYANLLLI